MECAWRKCSMARMWSACLPLPCSTWTISLSSLSVNVCAFDTYNKHYSFTATANICCTLFSRRNRSNTIFYANDLMATNLRNTHPVSIRRLFLYSNVSNKVQRKVSNRNGSHGSGRWTLTSKPGFQFQCNPYNNNNRCTYNAHIVEPWTRIIWGHPAKSAPPP